MKEIVKDTNDVYNRYLRYILLPFFLAYFFIVLKNKHEVYENEGGGVVSSSRDWGLVMQLVLPFPGWILNMHLWSAVLLFMSCLAQKELVRYLQKSWKDYIGLHKQLGYFILAVTLTMDLGGYLMGSYSKLPNFSLFNLFFASPWIIFVAGTYFSAKAKNIWAHRLFANMLFKGAISVPFSRLAGAVLQQLGRGEAEGYYEGIFGVAIIILIWELVDMYKSFTS
eukprot:TRINITY_DN7431_c0_g1_i1.p1 TRINITY_DN7431_c0_g1~~TRINITY_DN7431_c0_g1_i1.p1  ORF type:complete len:224 (-),score=36.98 TRINITY_DN7431_c0_g1_i1:10-681(-)